MKKTHLMTLLILFLTSLNAEPLDKKQFIDQINSIWKQRNYEEIYNLAINKIAQKPDFLEAHAVLFGYHIYISGNNQLAVASLDNIISNIESSETDVINELNELKNEMLLSIQSTNETLFPPTPEQIEALRDHFPECFPIMTILLIIPQK